VCSAVGCSWDERGTNGGSAMPLCGTNGGFDSNGAVIPDCAVVAGLEIPAPRRRARRAARR